MGSVVNCVTVGSRNRTFGLGSDWTNEISLIVLETSLFGFLSKLNTEWSKFSVLIRETERCGVNQGYNFRIKLGKREKLQE